MRQHLLNGWLAAALAALACLLGITAYAEVKQDLGHTACLRDTAGVKERTAMCTICSSTPCGAMARRA
ncbi:hypothetical protein FJ434_21190 [Mesorhizobium sp. B2-5-13]|uniref:hypothetical protein n=1 Tax=unclassified Mesorhizobium TaxID=325217 RepID=UPI00112D4F35|nr:MULTISPECIES: hypothetical protein [unclassified Mesorhizobium]TPJ39623.1 hypothetical protein FJ432_18895 [Mesorhizobium sp. B2-6-5]TPJ81576.1 hypothetical protein FJ434_21190 [Mesorhizobium sp. B2-5-13]TPK45647.1 hypothetical protein FJ560_20840 [Mesorhizobium sp. B2-5-5]